MDAVQHLEHVIKKRIAIVIRVRVGIVRVVVMDIGEHLQKNVLVVLRHQEHVIAVRVIVKLIHVDLDVIRI